MDEIFHVNQTQLYCYGIFDSYHPAITTPPGPYLLSTALLALPQRLLLGIWPGCSLPALRAVSTAAFGGLLWAGAAASRAQHAIALRPATPAWAHLATAALYPPLLLAASLAYTDAVAALAAVLAHAALHAPLARRGVRTRIAAAAAAASSAPASPAPRLPGAVWAAALPAGATLLATIAIAAGTATRQTNIVWGGFSCVAVLTAVHGAVPGTARASALSFPLFLLRNVDHILQRLSGPAALAVLFAAFLHANGGVVLGDKSHHVAGLHAAQLLYLAVPAAALAHAGAFRRVWRVARTPRGIAMLTMASGIAAAVMLLSAPAHPFLLADNRHYTFTFARRVLAHPLRRAALAPAFAAAAAVVVARLAEMPRPVAAAWVAASALTLVPSPLLEPRYFAPPLLLLGAYRPPDGSARLATAQALLFLGVHLVAVAVFLFRPYAWVDGTEGRLMW